MPQNNNEVYQIEEELTEAEQVQKELQNALAFLQDGSQLLDLSMLDLSLVPQDKDPDEDPITYLFQVAVTKKVGILDLSETNLTLELCKKILRILVSQRTYTPKEFYLTKSEFDLIDTDTTSLAFLHLLQKRGCRLFIDEHEIENPYILDISKEKLPIKETLIDFLKLQFNRPEYIVSILHINSKRLKNIAIAGLVKKFHNTGSKVLVDGKLLKNIDIAKNKYDFFPIEKDVNFTQLEQLVGQKVSVLNLSATELTPSGLTQILQIILTPLGYAPKKLYLHEKIEMGENNHVIPYLLHELQNRGCEILVGTTSKHVLLPKGKLYSLDFRNDEITPKLFLILLRTLVINHQKRNETPNIHISNAQAQLIEKDDPILFYLFKKLHLQNCTLLINNQKVEKMDFASKQYTLFEEQQPRKKQRPNEKENFMPTTTCEKSV